MKKLLGYLLVAFTVMALPLFAQNRTRFGGFINASDYAYGVNPNVPALINDSAPTSVGSATLTLRVGSVTAGDGTPFSPFLSGAPLPWFTIGVGSSVQETVQATAVSCTTPQIQDSCSVTATFSNSHAQGERIVSADYGVQEALNYMFSTSGSGKVLLDNYWVKLGGTNSTISSYVTVVPGVYIEDNRAGSGSTYLSPQPSATTLLSAPTTLSATTVTQPASCPTGATCSWTASQPYFSIAYVDILGNLSVGSTGYQPSGNLTASVPVNIAAPSAATGAVGWVAFAGTTANLLSYMLPVTTTATGAANGACTLTTLETVIPACALTNTTYGQVGSNASFNAIYVATNMLVPVTAETTTAIWNPVFQGHTTFLYEPTGQLPVPFQYNYGLFTQNTATEAEGITVVGTAPIPAGYLNQLGRTVRISGKVVATVTTAATPEIKILFGAQTNNYGTAGIPTTLCTLLPVGTLAVTTSTSSFYCDITTTTASTTATGAIWPAGMIVDGPGVTGLSATDSGVAAVGSLGLFEPGQIFVEFVNTATAATAAQLVDLHIETIQ